MPVLLWLSVATARALLAREPSGEVHDVLTRVLEMEDLFPADDEKAPKLAIVWRESEVVLTLDTEKDADRLWEAMRGVGLVR